MKEKALKYFIETLGLSEKRATLSYEKLARHQDILEEFMFWLETCEFPRDENAVHVAGYNARMLFDTTYLKEIGAYNYLVYLRENPAEALDNLNKGLPRR